MIFQLNQSVNQKIEIPNSRGIEVFIKREDRIHEFVSGNKYRKLKYNILEANRLGLKTLLTFGGAFSNHIAAVASAGKLFGFETIGVIRGEELEDKIESNATLCYAKACGMQFEFVSRDVYREKTSEEFINKLKNKFGNFYLVPEGGTNDLAIKGCEEILTEEDEEFDYICCAVGTGGTISGLINCSKPGQQVLGFPALKGDFLQEDISKFVSKSNWELIIDYHFGGYAKINEELVNFINEFKDQYQVSLDPVYTGKMMFGIHDLIGKSYFPEGSKILAIHTGGLQGITGMNQVLKKKRLPLIEI
ncbi:1-aminocyclopropane-1-carboxylate deaminase/D-cysteine desulfhydrase [Aestuariibaculum suncheonense]|uniref:1-aminocyclopropane-1-carboxylate deaminase/D-cysteine desulfhydrase n=1 Tax=Aestuariibaculum suncheonense TaxID=1028745 RepID=A0A8J6QFZ6_9FLAO|nr:pyridoxal-phosphate dependent enzyme [Aestuariibaculum suncheonense]MBD0835998.1 1-aminocyclopropane-1-carboxylate deaminase/D-cysteine desulfhydrase [Aestuariibaculum suncheonense]